MKELQTPEERLAELGLVLPGPANLPEGLHLPFSFINIRGDRALISGHPKQAETGGIAGPFGVVGTDYTTEQGYIEADTPVFALPRMVCGDAWNSERQFQELLSGLV